MRLDSREHGDGGETLPPILSIEREDLPSAFGYGGDHHIIYLLLLHIQRIATPSNSAVQVGSESWQGQGCTFANRVESGDGGNERDSEMVQLAMSKPRPRGLQKRSESVWDADPRPKPVQVSLEELTKEFKMRMNELDELKGRPEFKLQL
ncbi:hypothetical protein B0H13DRAFT_1858950 [Mycena leptocephala]|nr:hypothetical protein B0H13DRAFT_1858950 [Mycena leptocephala]